MFFIVLLHFDTFAECSNWSYSSHTAQYYHSSNWYLFDFGGCTPVEDFEALGTEPRGRDRFELADSIADNNKSSDSDADCWDNEVIVS